MRINDYCGKCVHVGTCNTCPDIIEQNAQGDIFACRKFQSSENTPENVDSKERVNENEPKNIDTLKDMKIKRIIRYCKINPGFSMCAISDICRQNNNCLLSEWPSADIDAAYELIKDKQPADD